MFPRRRLRACRPICPPLAGHGREAARTIDLSLELAPEHALEPLGNRDELVEVDARLDPLAVEHVHEVFSRDVSGGAGSEWTAPDASDRGIEHRRSRVDRRVRVHESRVASVVEVDTDGLAELDAL